VHSFFGVTEYWGVDERGGMGISSPSALLLVGRYHRDAISKLDGQFVSLIGFGTFLVGGHHGESVGELDSEFVSLIGFSSLVDLLA
jgi:hypothetical protein